MAARVPPVGGNSTPSLCHTSFLSPAPAPNTSAWGAWCFQGPAGGMGTLTVLGKAVNGKKDGGVYGVLSAKGMAWESQNQVLEGVQ